MDNSVYIHQSNGGFKCKDPLSLLCRFLIQVLPAAVVAPLYFRGEIEFGVINQSSSAFNHILTDVSLVVYQVLRCPRSCDVGPCEAYFCSACATGPAWDLPVLNS